MGCGCRNKHVKSYVDASCKEQSPYEDAESLLALDKCGNAIVVVPPEEYTETEKEKLSLIDTEGDGLLFLANDGEYKPITPSEVEEDPIFMGWLDTQKRIENVLQGVKPNDAVNFSQIENQVNYDSAGNIELRRGTKILATHPDGTQHELIGVNEYTIDGDTYLQSEVGDPAVHLNFNTNDDPNFGVNPSLDTPEGKKTVALFDQGVLFLHAKYFTPFSDGSGGYTLQGISFDEIAENYRKYSLGLRVLATNKNGFINDSIDYFAVEGNTYHFEYHFALADYSNLLVNVYDVEISAVINGELSISVVLENSFILTPAGSQPTFNMGTKEVNGNPFMSLPPNAKIILASWNGYILSDTQYEYEGTSFLISDMNISQNRESTDVLKIVYYI